MSNLKGTLLKQLIDISQPWQPKWLAKTLDDRSVLIRYEYGTLTVSFEGQNSTFVLPVSTPDDVTLTTEVMLLLTGLSVV